MAWNGWMLGESDTTVEFRDDPTSEDPNALMKRKVYSFTMYRKGVDIEGTLPSQAGQEITGTPTVSIGNAIGVSAPNLSDLKWVCTADSTVPIDESTGVVRQTQRWETYDDWQSYSLPSSGV